jgi:hypothetical protein
MGRALIAPVRLDRLGVWVHLQERAQGFLWVQPGEGYPLGVALLAVALWLHLRGVYGVRQLTLCVQART